MVTFKDRVLKTILKIPKGKLMSYGQVAARAGSPRAARQVGWILHGLDGEHDIPWWRVINNGGYISIKGNFFSTPALQRELLRKEKIKVGDDFKIDLEFYRWRK
jgi:methylated-DNA-protein-cysteine methyltransferase related protein